MESIEGYRGVPHLVLPLLEDLHSQTGAKVHSGGKLSSRFNTSSGVRQGCVLASALFCIAIDWILSQVIFLSDEVQAADCFNAVSNAAAPFGLRMSWTKSKVQNLGSGLPSSSLSVDGEVVEGVEEFVYLGSKQTSDGYCRPEIMRRIGLASAVMSSLRSVWNNRRLCVDTKVHIYCALVKSVLLYGSEAWTLLASDIKKLEAFYLRCQRQLLCVSWRDHITNEVICKQTKLTSLTELISRRRTSLVILLDLTQLSLHIEPCGCRRTFPQEGIRAPAGRDCQIVPGKH